jgi:hypothetical protein
MPFVWTKKIARVQPIQSAEVSSALKIQEIDLPVYTSEVDKISSVEHKNGKCLVSSREENDAFGGREEEVDGEEVVLARTEVGEGVLQEVASIGEEDSSSLASLKK